MDKRTQKEYIGWRAPELAKSGHYRDWTEIARMLRHEGAYIAHEVMTPFMRQRLNRLCREAVEPQDTPVFLDLGLAATKRLISDARLELGRLKRAPDAPEEARLRVESRIKDLGTILNALKEARRA